MGGVPIWALEIPIVALIIGIVIEKFFERRRKKSA